MCLLFVIYFRILSNLWYLFKLFQENISPEKCLLFVIYFRILSNLWYLFKLFQENISPEIALQRVDSRLPLP